MRFFLLFLLVFAFACQPSNTRGMCRDHELCDVSTSPPTCETLRLWYECDPEVEDQCEWQEFSSNRVANNSEALPCEFCDVTQCPEDAGAR